MSLKSLFYFTPITVHKWNSVHNFRHITEFHQLWIVHCS